MTEGISDFRVFTPKSVLPDDKLLKESIREELGISDEVSGVAEKYASYIKDNVEQYRERRKRIAPGVFYNVFVFNITVFEKTLKVECNNTYFSDRNVYLDYRRETPRGANKYDKREKKLKFNIDWLHDRPVGEQLHGSLQHELLHIFQNFKSNGNEKVYHSYHLAAQNINSESIGNRILSEIIYYSTDNELYAFANQAYEWIMHNEHLVEEYGDVRNAVSATNLYSGYEKLKNGLVFLKKHENDEKLHDKLKDFKTTYERITQRCEEAIKKYAKYIGRVIVKCERDLNNDNEDTVY